MHNTDAQLSEALTGLSVSQRTAVEAVLNHVTAIVTAEQVERLKVGEQLEAERRGRLILADKLAALEARVAELEGQQR